MKFRKLILPVILAVGALGALNLANLGKQDKAAETSAMNVQLYDEDMDVGINVKASASAAADWATASFFVNGFESVDVSGGDYLAFRMRSNNGGASYFDFIPNVGGNAYRVSLAPATGIKCVPAVPGGVAFDYGGARTWDLPLNFWADADVWFCIPKTSFTRCYFGSPINWNDSIWAIYFIFYGTTIDKVDFDIGNIWTANINGAGQLQKVNRICNWCNVEGEGFTGADANIGKLNITRNNPGLRNAVKLIQNIEYVDSCDSAASSAAYASSIALYNSLDADAKAYLDNYTIYDYASGDTTHANGKGTAWKASAKWAEILNVTGHGTSSARMVIADNKESTKYILIAVISAMALTTTLLIVLKKKKAVQK